MRLFLSYVLCRLGGGGESILSFVLLGSAGTVYTSCFGSNASSRGHAEVARGRRLHLSLPPSGQRVLFLAATSFSASPLSPNVRTLSADSPLKGNRGKLELESDERWRRRHMCFIRRRRRRSLPSSLSPLCLTTVPRIPSLNHPNLDEGLHVSYIYKNRPKSKLLFVIDLSMCASWFRLIGRTPW